jgi:hypothetical protein
MGLQVSAKAIASESVANANEGTCIETLRYHEMIEDWSQPP